MALSGSFYKYPVGQFGLYCEWSAVQNVIGNYSDVTLKVYLRYQSINVGARADSTIAIGDWNEMQSETYTAPAIKHYPNAYTNRLLKTKTVRIQHHQFGEATARLSAYWRFDGTYSGTYVGGITASKTVTLDTIDRSSPTINITVNEVSTSSISITATASTTCDEWEYNIFNIIGSEWINFSNTAGTKASTVISGLSPNKEYIIDVRARKRSNHVYGVSEIRAKTLGGAVINSLSPIIADNSTASVSYNLTVYSTSYSYTLSIGNILSINISTPSSTGTFNQTLTLTNAQRTALLIAVPSTAKNTKVTATLNVKNSAGEIIQSSTATAEIRTTAANSSPIFSNFSYSDVNPATSQVTGNSSIFVQGLSLLKVTAEAASAKNGAKISQYEASIDDIVITSSGRTLTCGAINTAGNLTLTVKAIDSRGYSTSVSKTVTVAAYEKVDISEAEVQRVNNLEDASKISLTAQISQLMINGVNKNAFQNIYYRCKETSFADSEYSEYLPIESDNIVVSETSVTLDNVVFAELNAEFSWDVQIRVEDKFTSDTFSAVLPPGVPLISKRRKCVGINNRNPESAFDVIGNIRMNGQNVQGVVRILEEGENLDDIYESGIYLNVLEGTHPAFPGDVGGFLEVFTDDNTFYTQRYTTCDMRRHMRMCGAGDPWSEWFSEDCSPNINWIKAKLTSPAEHYLGNEVMYCKRNGVVYIRGWFTGWSSGLTNVLFTLPPGYRPGQEMNFTVNVSGTGSGTAYVARMQILADGAVRVGSESVSGQISKGCSACVPPFLAEE